MNFASYIYNLFRGVDELGNAVIDGNSRQTISSRAYEAAMVKHIWYWHPAYHLINAVNYAIQIARGIPTFNHCKDAYLSDRKDVTYPGDVNGLL